MRLNLRQVLIGVFVFTLIEVVTLGLWFGGSVPPVEFSTFGKIALFVGLYLEHFASVVIGFNISTGKSWYKWPF